MTSIISGRDIVDPCAHSNPVLWRLFCAICDRPFDAVSPSWTEQDVCNLLIQYGKAGRKIHLQQMRETTTNDAGRTEEHVDQNRIVKFGSRDISRRDNKTGDVMAVGETSHTKISGDSSSGS